MRIDNQNTLRAQRAVDNFFIMGETHDFRDLPKQAKLFINAEPAFSLSHKMIKAHGIRRRLKDQRRPQLVIRKPLSP